MGNWSYNPIYNWKGAHLVFFFWLGIHFPISDWLIAESGTPGGTEVVSTAGECYGECPSSIYTGWILQGFCWEIWSATGVI